MVAKSDTQINAEQQEKLMQSINKQIDEFIAFFDENDEKEFWQSVCLYDSGVHNTKNIGANQIRNVIQDFDACVSKFVHINDDLVCKWNAFFKRFNDGEIAFNTLPESD
jgi:hypothetical protein